MAFKNFEELIKAASKGNNKRKCAAVAAPHSKNVAMAVIKAVKESSLDFILFGNRDKINTVFSELSYDLRGEERISVVHSENDREAAEQAVKAVRDGSASLIMKGSLETGVLLKEVVDKEKGIGTGAVMFHMMLVEIPAYHKLLGVTDGGMIISPTLSQKTDIIKASVEMFRRLGEKCPKVACLAAVEKVNPKMQETVEGAMLKEMAKKGDFGECIVEGPISTDLAFNKGAAAVKGYESPVTGDVDIVLVPGIASGNIMAKSLVEFAGAKTAGCILGAKVPISLTSRGASFEEEYNALMIAAAQA